MPIIDSIKIAFLAALFGHELQERLEPSLYGGRDVYRDASCRRLERWKRELQQTKESEGSCTESLTPLLNEIFLAEPLTRVWAAVYASRGEANDLHNSPQNVFLEHQIVRKQAIEVLADGGLALSYDFTECGRIRRQSERWSDLALACLSSRLMERVLVPQDYMIDVRRGEDYGFASARNRISDDDPCLEREGEQIANALKGLETAYPDGVSPKEGSTRHINEAVMECLEELIPASNAARIAFWHCRIDQASGIMH